jgi:hypothetical protein
MLFNTETYCIYRIIYLVGWLGCLKPTVPLMIQMLCQNIYTVKTPDADFRTYNRMPQDQTVHGAENVSCLWAA